MAGTIVQNQGLIQGGAGDDTLSLAGRGIIVNLASQGSNVAEEGIKGFEFVDMTASGDQTLKLSLADVVNNSKDKVLYVSGDSTDTVDFGADSSETLGGFTKGTEKESRTALDGKTHTYTAYTNGDVKVFVDDAITSII